MNVDFGIKNKDICDQFSLALIFAGINFRDFLYFGYLAGTNFRDLGQFAKISSREN